MQVIFKWPQLSVNIHTSWRWMVERCGNLVGDTFWQVRVDSSPASHLVHCKSTAIAKKTGFFFLKRNFRMSRRQQSCGMAWKLWDELFPVFIIFSFPCVNTDVAFTWRVAVWVSIRQTLPQTMFLIQIALATAWVQQLWPAWKSVQMCNVKAAELYKTAKIWADAHWACSEVNFSIAYNCSIVISTTTSLPAPPQEEHKCSQDYA